MTDTTIFVGLDGLTYSRSPIAENISKEARLIAASIADSICQYESYEYVSALVAVISFLNALRYKTLAARPFQAESSTKASNR